MPKYNTTRNVHHTARQMYNLVADVESYPQFVPMCQSLKIRGRERQPDETEVLIADMTVAYGPVRESFVSRVVLNDNNKKISVSYIDGPFKYLDNEWHFVDTQNGHSDVQFAIDYEFKSRTLGAIMGSMFDKAFRKFAEAFEKRADNLYN